MATAWGLSPTPPSRAGGRQGFRQLLPGAWSDFLTCRLGVEREDVRRFPSGYGVGQAEGDREKRADVLRLRKVRVWVVEGGAGAGREVVVRH